MAVGREPGAVASANAPEPSGVSPAPVGSGTAVLSLCRDRQVFLSWISDARTRPRTPAAMDSSITAPTSHQRYRGRRDADAASSRSPPHRMQKRPVSCPFAPHLGHFTANLQGSPWGHLYVYISAGFGCRNGNETPSPASAIAPPRYRGTAYLEPCPCCQSGWPPCRSPGRIPDTVLLGQSPPHPPDPVRCRQDGRPRKR